MGKAYFQGFWLLNAAQIPVVQVTSFLLLAFAH
jgi:hypothetical protein